MYRYRTFALNIQSDIEFPELPEAIPAGVPDVSIRLGPVPHVRKNGTGEDEYICYSGVGAFHIHKGCLIEVDPAAGVDGALLRVLLLGRMMAFLLRQRGWLPLHASGVLIEGEGVLFAGPGGTGKSTTAAAFHSRGHAVITDDVAGVRIDQGRCRVVSGGPHLRLHEDSHEIFGAGALRADMHWDKRRLDLDPHPGADVFPVKGIFLLEFGDETRTAALSPAEAVAMLSTFSFVRRRRIDSAALRNHVRDCAAVATVVPVRRLIRPRSMHSLANLVTTVEEELRQPQAGQLSI